MITIMSLPLIYLIEVILLILIAIFSGFSIGNIISELINKIKKK